MTSIAEPPEIPSGFLPPSFVVSSHSLGWLRAHRSCSSGLVGGALYFISTLLAARYARALQVAGESLPNAATAEGIIYRTSRGASAGARELLAERPVVGVRDMSASAGCIGGTVVSRSRLLLWFCYVTRLERIPSVHATVPTTP